MTVEKCSVRLKPGSWKQERPAPEPAKKYLRAINIETGEIVWEIPEIGQTDGKRLADIGKIIDDGKLRPLVQEVLPLEHAKKALELSRSRHVGGKIVLSI